MGTTMKQEMKQAKLRIVFDVQDDADAEQTRQEAKRKGLPIATMARMALREYLERESDARKTAAIR